MPLGLSLPRPDVQRVERVEPEPIRTVEQMEQLTHQLRRAMLRRRNCVCGIPRGDGYHKVCAGDPNPAIRRRLELG